MPLDPAAIADDIVTSTLEDLADLGPGEIFEHLKGNDHPIPADPGQLDALIDAIRNRLGQAADEYARRDQVLTEAAHMLRHAPVGRHETDGVDAAADLLLAARTGQEG